MFLLGQNHNLLLVILLGLFLFFGVPIILFVIGFRSEDKKRAKKFYIIATVYLLISFGICGGGI